MLKKRKKLFWKSRKEPPLLKKRLRKLKNSQIRPRWRESPKKRQRPKRKSARESQLSKKPKRRPRKLPALLLRRKGSRKRCSPNGMP